MKKILLTLLTILAIGTKINAQNVNIPDANFKSYLIGNSAINTNYDTQIQVSEATAFTGTINVYNKSISDLTGIEMFTNLTKLSCQNNSLTSLDLTQNTALDRLICSDNLLSSLDLSQNTALQNLLCENNSLTSLDLTQNTTLYTIKCQNNSLSSLDVSYCVPLHALECQNNSLTSLNIANGNNANFWTTDSGLNTTGNANLTCIKIDAGFTPPVGWLKDATASYGSNCGVLVSSITVQGLAGVSTIITNGGTLQMEATVLPTNASNSDYTWSVVNGSGSATINTTGLLTATSNGEVTVTATANDASGVTGEKVIAISNQTVGINELAFAKINIYPNPSNGLINLELAETLHSITIESIKLMDLRGVVVKKFNTETEQLDISAFTKGIYFLEIANAENKSVIKIIKK